VLKDRPIPTRTLGEKAF